MKTYDESQEYDEIQFGLGQQEILVGEYEDTDYLCLRQEEIGDIDLNDDEKKREWL